MTSEESFQTIRAYIDEVYAKSYIEFKETLDDQLNRVSAKIDQTKQHLIEDICSLKLIVCEQLDTVELQLGQVVNEVELAKKDLRQVSSDMSNIRCRIEYLKSTQESLEYDMSIISVNNNCNGAYVPKISSLVPGYNAFIPTRDLWETDHQFKRKL